MYFCGDCQSVHFPDQCRRGAVYQVTVIYAPPRILLFPDLAVDNPPANPKEPWSDLSPEPDPLGIICRPCSEQAHGECEGAERCRCQLCQIAPLIHDLEIDWDNRDREQGWPR